jgi:D-alanine--poly(phosphoribitol) ligase subunit 2
MKTGAPVSERILEILSEVTGSDDVRGFPDIELYASGIIDSLATVSLMLAFEEAFGITISPAEFDRESWATPRSLVADVERRLTAVRE